MNDLKVFNHSEFGELGVIEVNGKPYFPATACAKMLGYGNPKDAVKRYCRRGMKHDLPHPQNPEKVVTMNFIPESDLYRLIVSSSLPAAERFERWVMEGILPAIRHQGAYIPDMSSIVDIVSASVCEAVKQMVPSIRAAFGEKDDICSEFQEIASPRKKKRSFCAIEKLDPDLRHEVDRMLLSDRYSYLDVAAYLETQGIKLSQMAVCNYYNKMQFDEQDDAF